MHDTSWVVKWSLAARLGVLVVAAGALALVQADSPRSAPQLRIAYVTPTTAGPTPRDLFGQGLLGFHRAVKDFEIQGRVVQSDPNDRLKTITAVARQKFDLVFPGLLNSGREYDALQRLIDQYPETTFVVDFPYRVFLPPRPKNAVGTHFKSEEGAYLAGYLAALMERRRPGADAVSSVGGLEIFVVTQFIAGYQAGARKVNPRIKVLNGYAQSFTDPAKCRATALQQIAKGSGVVFNVAGGCGPGALRAAKEKGVWGVGVDVDQSFLGDHILTSALKRGDVWVYRTVEQFAAGKLKTGRTAIWTTRNGAVGLGRISPRVPREFVREVERIRAQIVAGKIRAPDTIK